MIEEHGPIKRTYREKRKFQPVKQYTWKQPLDKQRKILPKKNGPAPQTLGIKQSDLQFQRIDDTAHIPKFIHHEHSVPFFYDRTMELIGIDKAVNKLLLQYRTGIPPEHKLNKVQDQVIRHKTPLDQHRQITPITQVRKRNLGTPRPPAMSVFLAEGNDDTFSLEEYRKQRPKKTKKQRFLEANYFHEAWMIAALFVLLLLQLVVWNEDEVIQDTLAWGLLFFVIMTGILMLCDFIFAHKGRKHHGTRRKKKNNCVL